MGVSPEPTSSPDGEDGPASSAGPLKQVGKDSLRNGDAHADGRGRSREGLPHGVKPQIRSE